MMGIAVDTSGIRKTKPSSYVTRFVFGGAVTATAGLLGHYFGPAVSGLALAFPALLPASLTLVEQQEGRARAADDAAGAVCGAVGLAAFAVVVWQGAPRMHVAATFALATLAWLAVAVLCWKLLDRYQHS